jgi:AraC-like DNA-binding protein
MAQAIPLIRAAAIAPMRRWLCATGRDPAPYLAQAGLDWVPADDPFVPVPLRGAVGLLAAAAQTGGPDTPWLMLHGQGSVDLGFVTVAAFRGPTLGDGLRRIRRAMPCHSTHEVFTVEDRGGALHVGDGWAVSLGEDGVLHLVQQYVAALADMICSVVGDRPCLARIRMVPHPGVGFAHLRPWLGDRVEAAPDRALDLQIDAAMAARPVPPDLRARADARAPAGRCPLLRGQTLSDDVATLVTAMLPHRTPQASDAAAAAGLSVRSLRRRLTAQGGTFSGIVDRSRAGIALDRLQGPDPPSLGALASELGYADQATLTRAVRRWTGQTPRAIRNAAVAAAQPAGGPAPGRRDGEMPCAKPALAASLER